MVRSSDHLPQDPHARGGLRFPDGFLWGAATAAHQVEGDNRNTDWWRAEERGAVPYRSLAACDSWHRWRDDVRLLNTLGLTAYRLSVEWARIEPEPGCFDQGALDHYRRLLETLRGTGIEPVVTLHHFTNPLWLADRGGWTRPEVVHRFAAYADRVAAALGDLVQWWVTVNEPGVMGTLGYISGTWPPNRTGALRAYLRHVRFCAEGHGAARAALRARQPNALVSCAFDLYPMQPESPANPLDRLAVSWYDWLRHGLLFARTASALDWVGVNYYFRLFVRLLPRPRSAWVATRFGQGRKTDMGWEMYPEGLYSVLRRVGAFGKPVIVTENGLADAADGRRAAFIVAHLRQAHRAIRDGVDLRGYLHWSLVDNFEWAEGYAKRFGLAAVDFTSADKARTPRASAWLYRDIARNNGLTQEMLAHSDVR